jgi:hypothetical protein
MQPSGHHLYGMSSYLVPRAKPNCLRRLIVDFSPVNQLIESPASVVPEMSATLQFLQGKAFFSSIDLRYAYLGLRIDEASRPLTTFLTPSGSFQWLALPTGAANSPAYFIDAINKILHYEPVYGEDGKVIYESANVVKLKRSDLDTAQSYFDDIISVSHALPTYQESIDYHFEMLEKVVSRLAFHGAKISVPMRVCKDENIVPGMDCEQGLCSSSSKTFYLLFGTYNSSIPYMTIIITITYILIFDVPFFFY